MTRVTWDTSQSFVTGLRGSASHRHATTLGRLYQREGSWAHSYPLSSMSQRLWDVFVHQTYSSRTKPFYLTKPLTNKLHGKSQDITKSLTSIPRWPISLINPIHWSTHSAAKYRVRLSIWNFPSFCQNLIDTIKCVDAKTLLRRILNAFVIGEFRM